MDGDETDILQGPDQLKNVRVQCNECSSPKEEPVTAA
jgi:hypothetical protein